MTTLGELIRQRRADLGLTQEQLAARIDDGVRQAEVSRLEHGRVTLPRRPRLEQLARALELPVGELLLRSGWAGAEELPGPELQDRVDELTATNAELQERVEDLEQANETWQRWGEHKALDLRVAEATITQLEAVLNALPIPVVVVSPAGVVLVENTAYAAFSARHTDAPVMTAPDGVPVPPEALPLERASQGERFTVEVIIDDGAARAAYMVSGQPAATLRGGRIGVVTFQPLPS